MGDFEPSTLISVVALFLLLLVLSGFVEILTKKSSFTEKLEAAHELLLVVTYGILCGMKKRNV